MTEPAGRFDEWMFRHPDGRRWIGYLVGTYIADLATESSGLASHGVVFTGATSVSVERYRYRGSQIPTPWPTTTISAATATG